jgi:hypothetical protein
MLFTTFDRAVERKACQSGLKKLSAFLGGSDAYGRSRPIAMTTVLEAVGIEDTLWGLQATTAVSYNFALLLRAKFLEQTANAHVQIEVSSAETSQALAMDRAIQASEADTRQNEAFYLLAECETVFRNQPPDVQQRLYSILVDALSRHPDNA